jgi:hypothetical protein
MCFGVFLAHAAVVCHLLTKYCEEKLGSLSVWATSAQEVIRTVESFEALLIYCKESRL